MNILRGLIKLLLRFPEWGFFFCLGAITLFSIQLAKFAGLLPNANMRSLTEIWLWAMGVGALGSLVRVVLVTLAVRGARDNKTR